MSQETTKNTIFIKLFILLISSYFSMTAVADDAYFIPTVKGSAVQFSTPPIYLDGTVIRVVLSGPNDFLAEKTYAAGEDVVWVVNKTARKYMPNGAYNYEITMFNSYGSRQSTAVDLEGRTINSKRGSGTLSVMSGRWISPQVAEDDEGRDQQIADDLIVAGSACIGLDCVNNENFGFDTLRLKENNLRIRFIDTSNSAAFPGNDWELRANDTTNGGANKFSIVDADHNVEIFSVEADAPANSLVVDDRGRVGFGTSAPLLDQHLLSGNTPATRYEQDGSGGFPSQTWDIGGNETEFFIRDTTSAQVPVRVQPGAPSDSLIVNSAGDIEIGGSIVTNFNMKLPNKVLKSQGMAQLEALTSVEQYIIKNKQLPGIDTDSKDLLQLQLQLLEKVQELTLYTIEQDKRIAQLEAQLNKK